nr:cobalamin biosynthesis protein [Nakamurella flava]
MPVPVRPVAAGLLLGHAADLCFGDPRRGHPVAGFGQAAAALERLSYRDDRASGALHVLVLVGVVTAAGRLVERAVRDHPVARTAVVALATWTVLGGRSLSREADAVAAHLERDDLPAARERVTHLVGRDPRQLDAAQIARATVESVAENTSDAVVAPLLWGAVAGVPGLLGYRAVNTLDAMIGHRSPRYSRFGWAAARLDDVVNVVPARLAAALTAAAAPVVRGRPTRALRAVRRDAHRHPSPNAGPVEAAFAGALGVQLGGVNVYHGVVEDRGTLGDGPAPTVDDIGRARRLARWVGIASAAAAAGLAGVRPPGGGYLSGHARRRVLPPR